MDDDIAIPPPRIAKTWYCFECGGEGGQPDEGYHQMDRRYAIGLHHCKHAIKGKTPRVALVADFAWRPAVWRKHKEEEAMKAAYNKEQNNSHVNKEEAALAARYRVRLGIISNQDAKR